MDMLTSAKCENGLNLILFHKRTETIDVTEDEFPRHGTTMAGLARLRPCFLQDGTGTVTAGNASGINDGSAAVVLMSYGEATRRGVVPMARIVSWGQAGVDPAVMGTGPIPATRKAVSIACFKINYIQLLCFKVCLLWSKNQ